MTAVTRVFVTASERRVDTFGMQRTERDAYDARCLRVAAAAAARGATLAKSSDHRERKLVVSGNGKSVEFPIVSDERTWRETSVAQAFYSVLLDARSWTAAHVDDATIATLVDDAERDEVALIRKDRSDEMARIATLAEILGGRSELENIWSTVELASA